MIRFPRRSRTAFDPRELVLAEQRAAHFRLVPLATSEEHALMDRALGRDVGTGERMLSERLAALKLEEPDAFSFQITPPPTEPDVTDEGPVPAADAPVAEQVAFWRHRATWTASRMKYEQALVV